MATLSGIITPSNVLTESSTATLTNKTINGDNNTVTNVPLSTGVTGTLPIANGGTGSTSTTFANLTTNVTGTLPVANGGTGAATLTTNNVLLGNGTSAVQVVAPGTSGNVLTSDGTTWASTAPAGGGSLVLLQTVTGSGVDAIDVTGNFTSTYKFYKLYVSFADTSSGQPAFRLFIDGSLVTASVYGFTQQHSNSGGSLTSENSSSQPSIALPISGKNVNYEVTFFDPSNANHRNAIIYQGSGSNDGPDSTNVRGWANSRATGTAGQRAITGIRIFSPTGTYTARLYGIKEA
jgi:hypothetical protein